MKNLNIAGINVFRRKRAVTILRRYSKIVRKFFAVCHGVENLTTLAKQLIFISSETNVFIMNTGHHYKSLNKFSLKIDFIIGNAPLLIKDHSSIIFRISNIERHIYSSHSMNQLSFNRSVPSP